MDPDYSVVVDFHLVRVVIVAVVQDPAIHKIHQEVASRSKLKAIGLEKNSTGLNSMWSVCFLPSVDLKWDQVSVHPPEESNFAGQQN